MIHELKSTLIAGAIVALLAACQQSQSPADMTGDAGTVQSEPSAETMLAKAEEDYRTAIRHCDQLAAQEQDFCRQQADAALEAARNTAQDGSNPS